MQILRYWLEKYGWREIGTDERIHTLEGPTGAQKHRPISTGRKITVWSPECEKHGVVRRAAPGTFRLTGGVLVVWRCWHRRWTADARVPMDSGAGRTLLAQRGCVGSAGMRVCAL